VHKNQAVHDQKWREARRDKRQVRVTVWVPEDKREEIIHIARKMREKEDLTI